MARRARIHYVSLKSSLVNLPISIYGPLLERSIRPQNLAVHLTLPAANGVLKTEAYVGWTGMASASSLAHFNSADKEKGFETIEIDPQYAMGLGLAQGAVVEIGLLHDLPLAKSVGAEPVSADDWEIIELHAGHVEDTLLGQVRVAKIGQEIDVWVLGRTRVRLRVGALLIDIPFHSSKLTLVGPAVSLDPPSKADALLLTTNTEVHIAPKLRNAAPTAPKKAQTAASTQENALGPADKAPSTILRVLPAALHSIGISADSSAYTRPEPLAFTSRATFDALTSFTHSDAPAFKGTVVGEGDYFHRATLRLLGGPLDPSPGTPGKDSAPAAPEAKVLLSWKAGIPERHVVLLFVPDGKVGEWDLVSNRAPFLAGVDDILTQCTDYCVRSFALHASRGIVRGVSALLITGRAGAGKTSIAKAVAQRVQVDPRVYAYTLYIDLARHAETPVPALKGLFKHWWAKAAWHRPSVIVFDNVDKLMGVELEHADSFRTRHLTSLFVALYSAAARAAAPNARGIVVIGTAQGQASLHPLLSSAHVFSEIVRVKPPNKDARRDIMARIVERRLEMAPDIKADSASPLNFTSLATQTEGYSATDLHDLVARAMHQAAMRSTAQEDVDADAEPTLSGADFDAAQVDFVPLSLRDVKLQKSDVAWSDIGGLRETRRVLRETLEWPTKYGPIFKQSPLRLRFGLLLYGYPGCGKTLLASAVAKECGLNFISVKGPEILNKYIGASEKTVRDLFERASAAKPCVLFFDEFDSIAPKRGHDSTGVTDRVVNQMLTQMDGAEGLDGVYVLAATSRPDLIDSALLRPGRLDKSLLCDMPDVEDRKDILQAVSSKVSMAADIDWTFVAESTEGFSGADLQALVYNAHLEVVHSSIAADPGLDLKASGAGDEEDVEYVALGAASNSPLFAAQREQICSKYLKTKEGAPLYCILRAAHAHFSQHVITEDNIRKVLTTTQPSVAAEERVRLNRIYRGFVSDRSGDLPVPPDGGGVGNRSSLM
ncbi:AAA-domain-containing protein [Athelia psychrophila]|uniref:Peroxisomal ATPase PEX1 n=1 Tax=Athelia psychrophila TaxID=1759441 RepID=A0A167WVG3_9AGAM|nr:AAA-domain-containing protein [Fibularhizoctonia sp. CBS 109695]